MHGLERGSAGQVAFATRAEPAWHMLGEVFPEDEYVTTADMLSRAHLDKWDVRLRPLETDARPTIDSLGNPVQDFEVLRTNPFDQGLDRLAVVGSRYKVFQNEQLFAFGDTMLDGGGRWETAGSISGGRQVFGSLLLPKEIVLDPAGGADTVRNYLLVNTSHNGKVGIQASVTPVRVVCQNTLSMALGRMKQTYKIRHTASAEARVADAREVLGLSFEYIDAFESEARALYETEMSNREFARIVTALYPRPDEDKKGAKTRWENKVSLLGDIFAGSALSGMAPDTTANIRGTAWAGLNALTERLDWYRTPRKGNVTAMAEAASGFEPTTQAEKQRIRSAILEFAKDKGKVAV